VAEAASGVRIVSAAMEDGLPSPSDVAGQLEAGIGTDRVRARWQNCRSGLDRRAYRHAHRTPVLYSRNQSRTNIALYDKPGEVGAGQLAELLIMSLKR